MAQSHQPVVRSRPARAVRLLVPAARVVVAGLALSLSYIGLATGAFGPGTELAADVGIGTAATPAEVASLSYFGVDPVITGSVDHLFETASFTGPNRAAKTDRFRPEVDALAISRSFEEARIQIAALRGTPLDPTDLGQTRIADLDTPAAVQGSQDGPRMSVASIDPSTAAALDAIAGIAPQMASLGAPPAFGTPQGMPMPAIASEQLAYARANAPVTGAFDSGPITAASDKELWCLATAIYFEARGETYRGQVGVAQVVLNRVKDHRYPNTICGVVFQNQHRRNACQFSFACDGIADVVTERKPWEQAEEIAKKTTSGELYLTEVGDATHYHATYVRPAWAPRMTKVTQIGLHVFYKFKPGWLFG
ncbi:Spore cortex-lytic enzyme precursor [Devosia equisanguinis]|uniref:Spore cortex-lytic enzyme n=1 Tax=Devosia equisanguinis TaxID=2490941 RepID=A0A447I9C5_9HYPH|nr:cell wall hydrolase [Devosia equisanguinis]VDS04013.1 Spore cortex-lytic enzyme precursor [Devosia equisanguinis]